MIEELFARVWFTIKWFADGGQSLSTTWKASGVFVRAMRNGTFKLRPWEV